MAVDDACWIAASQVADKLEKEPAQMKGVAFENAFHGRYGLGAQATDSPKVEYQHRGQTEHVSAPELIFDDKGQINQELSKRILEQSMNQVEELLKQDDYAYVIIEYPFQAEGGARVMNPNAMRKLHEICQKHGKLLIADCVQMGGRAWRVKDDGQSVSPFPYEVLKYADLITFGKIFRTNGTLVRDFTKLGRGFHSNIYDEHPERWSGTWTGHLPQMLTGYAFMQTILKKELWRNAIKITKTAVKRLMEISENRPGLITSIKSIEHTAYLGWDFASPQLRQHFQNIMLEEFGIIVLPARETAIRWAPNVDTKPKELEKFFNAVAASLEIMAN